MAVKNALRSAAKFMFLPLLAVACSSMSFAPAPANDTLPLPTPAEQKAAPAEGQENIVNETFLLKNMTINFTYGGQGGLSMHIESQSGKKNTGTGAYRTDLTTDINCTPFGAAENINGTNNGLVFKKIQFQGDPENSNNRQAYVEFEIQPLNDIRSSVQKTASSAYTIYPAFARNLDDIDLDSVDINNAAIQQSYGVRKLVFKGIIQDLRIVTDKAGSQQSAANALKNVSSNGLLITSQNIRRTVYQNADPNTYSDERMEPTPKNIYILGK